MIVSNPLTLSSQFTMTMDISLSMKVVRICSTHEGEGEGEEHSRGPAEVADEESHLFRFQRW